jgi:prephenate dehydratase
MNTIAYQGRKGAFSYITAVREFGQGNLFLGEKTFKDVFQRLESGEADYAILPIENSLAGSIYENYDLLCHYEGWIVAEHYTKIVHCLLTVSTGLQVFSHPKALEQCAGFFRKYPWIEAVSHMDTAGAAEEIAQLGNPEYAAIASSTAGRMYGLQLLLEGIEDDPANYTRFLTVAKKKKAVSMKDKGSLAFQMAHSPGVLATALSCLARCGMNLTKIESRPLRGRPFEYQFYVDFEFSGQSFEKVEGLVKELGKDVHSLKILGFYKAGQKWIR